jgi:hypothetical protein
MQNHFHVQTSKCFTVFQGKKKEKKKTRSKPEELLLKISLHRVFFLHNLLYKSQEARGQPFETEKLPRFLSLALSLSHWPARWLGGGEGGRERYEAAVEGTKRPTLTARRTVFRGL